MSEGFRSAAIEIHRRSRWLEAIEIGTKRCRAYVVDQELNEDNARDARDVAAFGGHMMLSDDFPEFINDVRRARWERCPA